MIYHIFYPCCGAEGDIVITGTSNTQMQIKLDYVLRKGKCPKCRREAERNKKASKNTETKVVLYWDYKTKPEYRGWEILPETYDPKTKTISIYKRV